MFDLDISDLEHVVLLLNGASAGVSGRQLEGVLAEFGLLKYVVDCSFLMFSFGLMLPKRCDRARPSGSARGEAGRMFALP